VAATAGVLWIAFGKLAEDYEAGLQRLGETVSRPKRQGGGRRWADVLAGAPPLRWWLRDSVSRASFLLVTAYLMRDRDVKLRIYPALAPVMVMPFIFLFQPGAGNGAGFGHDFGVAFSGAYLGMVPMMSLNVLQYSQQWQASDIFRVAPMAGPAALCNGARRAVLCFLTLPMLLVFGLITRLMHHDSSTLLLLLLPGMLALPVFAMVPCLMGEAVPLSKPTEEAKATSRGWKFFGIMMISMAVSGFAYFAWITGWFWWLMLVETVAVVAIYAGMRASLRTLQWSPAE
jgi:ABC-2 type transport system permease protein